MSIRHKAALPLLVCALALPIAAHADTTAAVRRTLAADYAKEDSAMQSKNANLLLADCAPSFVDIDQGKSYSLAQAKSMLGAFLKQASGISAKQSLTKLTVNGDQAVALVSGTLTFSVKRTGGKTVHIKATETSRDTWKKLHGKWLRTKSETLSQNELVNGKPFLGQR